MPKKGKKKNMQLITNCDNFYERHKLCAVQKVTSGEST